MCLFEDLVVCEAGSTDHGDSTAQLLRMQGSMFASFNAEASGGVAGAVWRLLAGSADHANDNNSSVSMTGLLGSGSADDNGGEEKAAAIEITPAKDKPRGSSTRAATNISPKEKRQTPAEPQGKA